MRCQKFGPATDLIKLKLREARLHNFCKTKSVECCRDCCPDASVWQKAVLGLGVRQGRLTHHKTRGEVGRHRRDDGRVERRAVAGRRLEVLVDRLATVNAVVFGEDAKQRAQLQPPLIHRQLVTAQQRRTTYTGSSRIFETRTG